MSEQVYPTPCTHCGMCCLTEVCPSGQKLMALDRYRIQCPALEWENGESRCGLMRDLHQYCRPENIHPFWVQMLHGMSGQGCCISMRLKIGDDEIEFAPLDPQHKVAVVDKVRSQRRSTTFQHLRAERTPEERAHLSNQR